MRASGVTVGLGLVWLLVGAASAAGGVAGEARAPWAAVDDTGDRSVLVSELGDAWREAARGRGFDPEAWSAELETVLAGRGEESLRTALKSRSYEEFLTALGIAAPAGDALGELTRDLVYVPLPPCRILDSTLGTGDYAGPLPNDVDRHYSHTVNLPAQGGNSAGCGVPADAAAVMLTFNVVSPQGAGSLMAREFGAALPPGRVVYYLAASTSVVPYAATTAVRVCPLCGFDFTVRLVGSSAHLRADVLGYFRAPAPTALACSDASQTTIVGSTARSFDIFSRVCPTGTFVTGGGFDLTATSNPPPQGLTIHRSAPESSGSLSRWVCSGRNDTGQVVWVRCNAQCCQVPGR